MKNNECPPPSWNTRCIVFTLTLALGYWYLPSKNKWILLALLYFPYLAMAWYDHVYDCRRNKLGPTYLARLYAFAKPPDSLQIKQYRECAYPQIRLVDTLIVVLSIAATPLFL